MAYFLGYKKNLEYKPLILVDYDGNIVPNKILDIISFTNLFISELDLKNYLYETRVIDNIRVDLCYLIDKGKKDEKVYEPIKMGNTMYLSESSIFFNPEYIKKYLYSKSDDIDFIIHVYAYYLRKTGTINKILDYLKSISLNIKEFKNTLEKILENDVSFKFKGIVDNLLDLINDTYNSNSNSYRKFTKEETLNMEVYINELYYSLLENDNDLVSIFNFFSRYVKYPNIPCINCIKNIYYIAKCINDESIENSNYKVQIKQSIFKEWDRFHKAAIYTYDTDTKKYKIDGNSLKIQERNLADLGMLLYNYEAYLREIMRRKYIKTISEDVDDDYEEFLEEEDFTRYNTTSENEGYTLKVSDCQRGYKYNG